MAAPELLGAFGLLVLLVVLTPGADMVTVTASALGGGRPAGLGAVAGIAAGVSVHVLVTAAGIGALFAAFPFAVRGVGLAGGAYLVCLGLGQIRLAGRPAPAFAAGPVRPAAAFRHALAINLLNPKAYLFMLAVLPQFVRAGGWPAWLQTLTLGGCLLAVTILAYAALALAAACYGPRLLRSETGMRRAQQGAGLLLLVLGAGLLASQLDLA